MNYNKTAKLIEEIVKNKLSEAEKGHDWYHIERVRNTALKISETEGGDKQIIEVAALLHDISDAKFNGGNYEKGALLAGEIMLKAGFDSEKADCVVKIIDNISFKGGNLQSKINSAEFKIVQDADRLDAIGAIGIARTFHYGGYKNREIYNPEQNPQQYANAEQYHKSNSHTINHFYEKLLKLKDLMNTETAKKIAEKRHNFMLTFLDNFFEEWNFNK